MKDYLFWVTILVYVVVRILVWHDPTAKLPPVQISHISMISGFVTFFMVFFSTQSYTRFLTQYQQLMNAKGAIFDFTLAAVNQVPKERAMRLVRWLNAANILAYVGLSSVYENHNLFLPLVKMYKLLTPEELERIEDVDPDAGSVAYREILAWVLSDVASMNVDKTISDRATTFMWLQVTNIRYALAQMFDNDDQPIPFVYVHLIYFLSLLFLPIMSYSVAVNVGTAAQESGVELLGGLIVFITTVFFLGLRDLGHVLQDPLGDDLQDLSVIYYVTYTIQMSRRLFLSAKPLPFDAELEIQMECERPSMGPAFETGAVHRGVTVAHTHQVPHIRYVAL